MSVDFTRDCPAPGLVVHQPRRGFRYGAEAFWAVGVGLATGSRPRSALDLGTGSGIMALMLGRLGIPSVGVEIRREWQPLWDASLADSTLQASVTLRHGDVACGVPERADLIVSNPPFFRAGAGPRSPDTWRASARTESTATLLDFRSVAMAALTPSGRAVFVVPRERARVLSDHTQARQVIHVGKRRTVVVFGSVDRADERCVPDRGAEVDSWYRLAGAASGV